MSKKTYTAKERKAYHMGRAYAAAKAGKRVKCTSEKEKQSFRNGVNAVRGRKSTAKKAGKQKKSADGIYLVDANGEVFTVING